MEKTDFMIARSSLYRLGGICLLVFLGGGGLGFGIGILFTDPTSRPSIVSKMPERSSEAESATETLNGGLSDGAPLPVKVFRSESALKDFVFEEPVEDLPAPAIPPPDELVPVPQPLELEPESEPDPPELPQLQVDRDMQEEVRQAMALPSTEGPNNSAPATLEVAPTEPLRSELATDLPNAEDAAPSEVSQDPQVALAVPATPARWLQRSLSVAVDYTKPMVAVVIDDLGIDQKRTRRMLAMKGPMTMAFIPYGYNLRTHVEAAKAAGHEVMLHMPMEPLNPDVDPGPNALLTSLDKAERQKRLLWAFEQFDGFVGINNHMGSRFTAWPTGMREVLSELKARGLLFLDSITSQQTVGFRMAREMGLAHATRDVFLDHDMSRPAVAKALKQTERLALSRGYAVAIGHPHDGTMDELEVWIAKLEGKGIQLVPISAIVKRAYPQG